MPASNLPRLIVADNVTLMFQDEHGNAVALSPGDEVPRTVDRDLVDRWQDAGSIREERA